MLSGEKKRRIIVLFIGGVVCLALMVSLAVMGSSASNLVIHFGDNVFPVSSLAGVLSSLLTATCIVLVCFEHNAGSIEALIILTMQLFSILMTIKRSHSLSSLPGAFNISIMMIIILILRRFFTQREKESITDYLTGLRNRRGFMKSLNEADPDSRYYIIYVDLDDFKLINDNLGHKSGNQVLNIIADRMREIAGKKTVISRIGGDEFVVMIPGAEDPVRTAEKLIARIGESMEVMSGTAANVCYVTASAGIACYPDDAKDSDSLMKYADIAMYKAKNSGKNKVAVFDKGMEDAIIRQAELEGLIKESLDKDYFYLVYQPQYICTNKELRGFETLIRMKTADGTFVSPGEFISAAEKTDLIFQIDEYVLNRAMSEFGDTVKASGNKFILSINVSAKNICRHGFADMVLSIADKTCFPCECLEIEITEYCLAQSVDIAEENISLMKKRGVQIALDDFGTGYASLSYLSKLSIDLLKIDKSFVDETGTKKSDDFISAVISIGHLHDCHVISEGVETEEQLNILKEKNCDFIQGYIWGKPMPYDEAVKLAESFVGQTV